MRNYCSGGDEDDTADHAGTSTDKIVPVYVDSLGDGVVFSRVHASGSRRTVGGSNATARGFASQWVVDAHGTTVVNAHWQGPGVTEGPA
jgi:hypothetical protein